MIENGTDPFIQLLSDPLIRYGFSNFFSKTIADSSMSGADRRYLQGNAYLNNAYYRGPQYLTSLLADVPSGMSASGAVVGGTINDMAMAAGAAGEDGMELSAYTLPIFYGDVSKLLAVLGTRAPNIKAGIYVPGSPNQERLRRKANQVGSYIRNYLQFDQQNAELVAKLLLSGTVFGGVFWKEDPLRFGSRPISAYRQVAVPTQATYFVCDQCGETNTMAERAAAEGRCKKCEAPLGDESRVESEADIQEMQQQVIGYGANGVLELLLCDVTMFEVPFMVQELAKSPWGLLEYEDLKWSVMNRYLQPNSQAAKAGITPQMLDFSHGAGSLNLQQYPTDIRSAIQSPSGDYSSVTGARTRDFWLQSELWLTPAMFTAFDDSMDRSGRIRETLTKHAARGARVCFVNAVPVGIYPETFANHWRECRPSKSVGIFCDAVMSNYRVGVDVLNDVLSLMVDIVKHSPGELFFDSSVISETLLERYAARPGRWIPTVESAMELAKRFFRVPGANFDEALPKFLEAYLNWLRESVGITPALFGAGPGDETAHAAEIRRTQALMQQQPLWQAISSFWAGIGEISARILAEKSGGWLFGRAGSGVDSQPDQPTLQIQGIEMLKDSGWFYQVEEAMPQSPGARRGAVMEIASNPASQLLFSLVDAQGRPLPQNLNLLSEVVQLPDWWIAGLNEYNHVQEILQGLVEGVVAQPPIGDPSFDPGLLIMVLPDWLHSDLVRDLEPDHPAVQAAREWLEWAQMMIAQQQQAAMAQQGVGAGPGGGGGETEGGEAGPPSIPPPPSPAEEPSMPPPPPPDQMGGDPSLAMPSEGDLLPEELEQLIALG